MEAQKCNGLAAANNQPAETYTLSTTDYPTGKRLREEEATQCCTPSGYAIGEQLSFLPPPPFCPTWPTRGTLADKALGLLMDGRMIDHPDFENITQSWRLGAVIFTLRTLGWPVESIDIPSPTEHSPDRVICLYRLDGKYTAQALAINGRVAHVG